MINTGFQKDFQHDLKVKNLNNYDCSRKTHGKKAT